MADSELEQLRERLDIAERVCLMAGWSPAIHDSKRSKALHELWSEWDERYGKDAEERHRAHLSDERIDQLARKRDETRARTLARFGLLET